mmetsp:Transcript_16320/g.39125  ORF Transcript_16320/g.39125 Transcript_16320/m.39125 type:complete len:168 (+) Transcript_16320:60-563(+)
MALALELAGIPRVLRSYPVSGIPSTHYRITKKVTQPVMLERNRKRIRTGFYSCRDALSSLNWSSSHRRAAEVRLPGHPGGGSAAPRREEDAVLDEVEAESVEAVRWELPTEATSAELFVRAISRSAACKAASTIASCCGVSHRPSSAGRRSAARRYASSPRCDGRCE